MSGSQQEAQARPVGRPSEYSPETAALICERIAGGESLRSICKDEALPAASSVYRWLADASNADFREQYARAREAQADVMADEILGIADDTSQDTVYTDKGTPTPNTEWISRSKLRVDARFKLMALLAPKKYGTKLVDVTSGGSKISGIQLVDFDGSPVSDV